MTAEPDRMTLPPGARLIFVEALDSLPLADPTEAARFLKVRRHTLACYRNLGSGPPYYKFGRWIRYAWVDLLQWAGLDSADGAWPQLDLPEAAPPGAVFLADTPTAARFLTVTSFCLANYRSEGGGPRFCRFGRRIHYPVDELLGWARRQRSCQELPRELIPEVQPVETA
ncbi:hypothetical protein GCM10023232_06970 [Sphingosinicella ginsenosidimutans]|uniref:Helix-turn-helix domain-containing protein n=1 Tax=Allosphingosinicella ginsenosidimutans TaxID=1176539 RepID=A0A5C6TX67_9SPHN|nr:helix-turn-helix domain-containing protein [Sphingosinicella ginsenosidimutans]TXC64531.1 helix-turn-helix domain-containing protein [Sphingosinicella ginsenosidimutans]